MLIIRDFFTQKAKAQKLEELLTETQSSQKKYEEFDTKIKEKDIKIGQLTNFSNSLKTKLQAQQKTIEDLQKQVDYKAFLFIIMIDKCYFFKV